MLILTVSRMCFPFLIVGSNIIIGGLGKEINVENYLWISHEFKFWTLVLCSGLFWLIM